MLDKQVLDKKKVKLQLQQDQLQYAQDLAAALKQHKIDEAKAAAARQSAALQTKALMAGQVGQGHCHVSAFLVCFSKCPFSDVVSDKGNDLISESDFMSEKGQ